MKFIPYLSIILTIILPAQAAQQFQLAVTRERISRRGEPGTMTISEAGIAYKSLNNKTSLRLPLTDIWEADLSHPSRISIQTYDRDALTHRTTYQFRLPEATDQQVLARFFAEHLERPVIGQYSFSSLPVSEIPAYHRHVLGGVHGTIRISAEGIEFISDQSSDARTWLYRDIDTVGSADPFHFRITSFVETYTFDLKKRLPQRVYDLAWQNVNQLRGSSSISGSH